MPALNCYSSISQIGNRQKNTSKVFFEPATCHMCGRHIAISGSFLFLYSPVYKILPPACQGLKFVLDCKILPYLRCLNLSM
jgi:hypothetical protein